MLKQLYLFSKQYDLKSILAFILISASMYFLFRPQRTLRIWLYTLSSAVLFTCLYVGGSFVIQSGAVDLSIESKPYFLYYFCGVGTGFLWAMLFLRGTPFSKATCLLFFFLSIHLYNTATSPYDGLLGGAYMQSFTIGELLISFGQYLLIILLTTLFHCFQIDTSVPLDYSSKAAMLFVPFSLLTADVILLFRNEEILGAPILSGILLINIPVIYLLISKIVGAYEERHRLDTNLSKLKAEQYAYQKTYELSEMIRQERHEMKNRYFRLQTLLYNEEYDELSAELERISGIMEQTVKDLHTGNTFLDYLISHKIETAKRKRIPVVTEILLPSNLKIDEEGCGSILSNLLDNAIEASEKESEPTIRLVMSCCRGYLCCQISNHVSKDPLTQNPSLLTTKMDKNLHGYGMKIVRRQIQNLNGMLDIKVENGCFTASFMLPLNNVH